MGNGLGGAALRQLAADRGFGTVGDASFDKFMANIGSNPSYGLKVVKTSPQVRADATINALKERKNLYGGQGNGVNLGAIFKKAFTGK